MSESRWFNLLLVTSTIPEASMVIQMWKKSGSFSEDAKKNVLRRLTEAGSFYLFMDSQIQSMIRPTEKSGGFDGFMERIMPDGLVSVEGEDLRHAQEQLRYSETSRSMYMRLEKHFQAVIVLINEEDCDLGS